MGAFSPSDQCSSVQCPLASWLTSRLCQTCYVKVRVTKYVHINPNAHVHVPKKIQRMVAEIWAARKNWRGEFYNPKTSDEQSLKWFDTSVRRASQIKNAALLIGGDFNLPNFDWKNKVLKPNSSHQKVHYYFCNTLDDLSLTQLVE